MNTIFANQKLLSVTIELFGDLQYGRGEYLSLILSYMQKMLHKKNYHGILIRDKGTPSEMRVRKATDLKRWLRYRRLGLTGRNAFD